MEYRRNYVNGGTYFFTVVTYRRRPILNDTDAYDLFKSVIRDARAAQSFDIEAAVILPDHLHMIWTLPAGDDNYSQRWSRIKSDFTRRWLADRDTEPRVSAGKRKDGRRGVWQPKFYEHTIRDEDDMIRHVEYIHYNPVKHGHVRCPKDWPRSSFHRYVREGIYPIDWCCGSEPPQGAFASLDLE